MLLVEELRYLRFGPVTFSVRGGECAVIRGASGAGKSMMLRAISDLDLDHTASVISLNDEARDSLPANEWRRRIGILPSYPHWWRPTVREHFQSPDNQPLNALGLPDDAMSWDVKRLSAGEAQRLALLRTLDRHPDALLLDEPTANLDSTATLLFEKFITEYKLKHHIPVVWVSHSAEQTKRIADGCYLLVDGALHPEDPHADH